MFWTIVGALLFVFVAIPVALALVGGTIHSIIYALQGPKRATINEEVQKARAAQRAADERKAQELRDRARERWLIEASEQVERAKREVEGTSRGYYNSLLDKWIEPSYDSYIDEQLALAKETKK